MVGMGVLLPPETMTAFLPVGTCGGCGCCGCDGKAIGEPTTDGAPGGGGVGAVFLTTLNVRLVVTVPFLMVTSFLSTLMASTSTDSIRSPSARLGLIICLPGAGMILSNTSLVMRMIG